MLAVVVLFIASFSWFNLVDAYAWVFLQDQEFGFIIASLNE